MFGLSRFRERLATGQAPLEHAMLGLAAGFLAGGLVVLFRRFYEWGLASLYPVNERHRIDPEQIDSLPLLLLFLAPTLGGLAIGLAMALLAPGTRQTGLAHVVYHVHNHDGKLPWRNALVQFFGGVACFISGQSVGREGPAVHIGAASNSIMGQVLRLPYNSLRILAGCGTAAAIAASFNTPIAGVIFAMEVVLAEYTITGFMPVILAAVAGTIVSRWSYGAEPYIALPGNAEAGLFDLGLVVVLAVLVSLASASFVLIQRRCLRFSDRPIWLRMLLAGMLTGSLALFAPRILGAGYAMLEQMLASPATPLALGIVIAAKLVTTATSVGLGMPGGLISPNLFIGASIGSLVGQSIQMAVPALAGSPMMYALLGMAAMMSAVLNAPLAALMTLMELTYSPDIIFPGMLAITVANIFHREVFSQPSAVSAILQHQGIQLEQDPVSQALKRIGVSSLMDSAVELVPRTIPRAKLAELLDRELNWIAFENEGQHFLARASSVSDALGDSASDSAALPFDISTIKGVRAIESVDTRANLYEAWRIFMRSDANAVLVQSRHASLLHSNVGIVTRKAVEAHLYYRYGATP